MKHIMHDKEQPNPRIEVTVDYPWGRNANTLRICLMATWLWVFRLYNGGRKTRRRVQEVLTVSCRIVGQKGYVVTSVAMVSSLAVSGGTCRPRSIGDVLLPVFL